MTNFLDDLERELRAAHPRRRRAARRAAIERTAHRAPAAVATVAVLGGATAFVVSTGDQPTTHSGASTTSGRAAVIVVNSTGRSDSMRPMRDFFTPRRGRVFLTSFIGNRISRTTVYYAKGHRSQAGAVASEMTLRFRPMSESGGLGELGAPLVVAVGADYTRGRTVALTDAEGAEKGSLTTVQIEGKRYAEIQSDIERGDHLAVWLRGAERSRFLGFVATPVKDRTNTLAVAMLPEGDLWPELVVSRERGAKPGEQPANVLLTAKLDG